MLGPLEASLMVQAFACNARVAGMVAANQHRLDCGNSIAYDEDAFNYESENLERIAQALHYSAG